MEEELMRMLLGKDLGAIEYGLEFITTHKIEIPNDYLGRLYQIFNHCLMVKSKLDKDHYWDFLDKINKARDMYRISDANQSFVDQYIFKHDMLNL